MRTTIRLPDDLLRRAKARAAENGRTLNTVIEQAVRDWLESKPPRGERPPLPLMKGEGWVHPGVDLDDNAAVLALMEEDLPLDKLR